jgi:hypothetical protein
MLDKHNDVISGFPALRIDCKGSIARTKGKSNMHKGIASVDHFQYFAGMLKRRKNADECPLTLSMVHASVLLHLLVRSKAELTDIEPLSSLILVPRDGTCPLSV